MMVFMIGTIWEEVRTEVGRGVAMASAGAGRLVNFFGVGVELGCCCNRKIAFTALVCAYRPFKS
jgi:hypothetical protein